MRKGNKMNEMKKRQDFPENFSRKINEVVSKLVCECKVALHRCVNELKFKMLDKCEIIPCFVLTKMAHCSGSIDWASWYGLKSTGDKALTE